MLYTYFYGGCDAEAQIESGKREANIKSINLSFEAQIESGKPMSMPTILFIETMEAQIESGKMFI